MFHLVRKASRSAVQKADTVRSYCTLYGGYFERALTTHTSLLGHNVCYRPSTSIPPPLLHHLFERICDTEEHGLSTISSRSDPSFPICECVHRTPVQGSHLVEG